MGQTTYKDLFRLVQEQIAQREQFAGTKTFRNQLDRTDIGPLFSNPISDVRASEIIASVQQLLDDALPEFINEGLEVTATSPESNKVKVSAGKGSKGGALFTLFDDTTIEIPFDLTTEVFYLSLFRDRLMIDKNENKNALTLARIIIPVPGQAYRIYDRKEDREDPREAYIVGNRPVRLYTDAYGRLEEDSIEFLRDNIGPVLADNIIGNIRLSENLKISNTQGSLELDSSSIKIFNSSQNVIAKFTKDGTFYYDSNGVELAKFATSGARVGNIVITPSTIQSGNFVSGSLGAGFRIEDSGDAEFNNVKVRGKLSATVFEKDTVSVIGGNLLVMDGDILDADMTALNNSPLVISGDTSFAVNDILRIKDGVQDEWLQVTASSGNSYTVTRDLAGQYTSDLNPTWQKGTSVVNYGQSGEGGVFLTSSESNSPYISIITHAGSPWSATTTHARFGNLNGFLGYVTDAYGIAIGTTDDYLKYDPINGLQIKGSIIITGGDIPPKTYYQDTEPGSGDNINENDYWVDTNDNNKLYIYQSGIWVEISASSSSGGITTFNQGSITSGEGIPVSLNIGDVWYDSDTNKVYRAASVGADQITAGEWILIPTAGTDDNGNLTTSVIPGCNIGTPVGAGLYLGADYMGYFDNSCWKSFIKNDGTFAFKGDSGNFVAWDGATMCVRGLLNADDITVGSLCADRIGAGQIFLDAGIQITSNQTVSGDLSRTTLDSTGLKSYDSDGNITTCISNGCFYGESIKLQDPSCVDIYSYLSGGILRFHDELGDVPYIKRICHGVADNGDWICLTGWKNSPNIIVSPKALDSYNPTYANQAQTWNVSHSDVTCYVNSGMDYGYCFKVNAVLELAAGQSGECIVNANFSTCTYTLANTCCATVKHKLRFYCHGTAPANWCYGCFCWKICYRCFGCGVWCETTPDFTYIQPHASTIEMTTINDCSLSVNFGASSGPTGCWEIMAVQTGLTFHDSGIASGSTVTDLCSRSIGTGRSTIGHAPHCITTGCYTCACSHSTSLSLAGTQPSNTVYCAYVCYCWCTVTACCLNLCLDGYSTFSGARHQGCTGASFRFNSETVDNCNKTVLDFPGGGCYTCNTTCSFTSTARCDALNPANSFTAACICTDVCLRICGITAGGDYVRGKACADVCFLGGTLYQCYCYSSGSAEGDATTCVYSLCNTLATACVIDCTGVLNWLAIAYT